MVEEIQNTILEDMKMNKTTLALVMPCYNEEAVLNETILRLNKVLENLIEKDKISRDSFMLFVDDVIWLH